MTDHDDLPAEETSVSRRVLLAAGGAVGLGSLLGAQVTAQEQSPDNEENEDRPECPEPIDGETIVLGVGNGQWIGVYPRAIQQFRNPTLRLEAGTQYDLTWVALDSAAHKFVIEQPAEDDEEDDDEIVVETDTGSGLGMTRSVAFEADEEMERYRCFFDPETGGSVRVEPAENDEAEETEENDEGENDEDDDGPFDNDLFGTTL